METYHPSLTPNELGKSVSALGIKKANTRAWQLFLLGILAGLYISLGGHVFLVALNEGAGKIVAGSVFAVGLVLVVIAGAELFTGNIIMIVGSITGRFPLRSMLRNWLFVYLGNLVGAFGTAVLIWHSGLLGHAGDLNDLGQLAAKISDAKLVIPFGEAVLRGFFCNILVILAILMALLSKDTISKIACCILPIMAFVAAGFEHCVANMYLIPLGELAGGSGVGAFTGMWSNLLPVTLGNILGGIFILIVHPNRIRQIQHLIARRRHATGGSTRPD